jgi:hypothetical protein
MSDEITEEIQAKLKLKRSAAFKEYIRFIKEGGVPEPGAGKGHEPIEKWCSCHNRYPCPLLKELEGV